MSDEERKYESEQEEVFASDPTDAETPAEGEKQERARRCSLCGRQFFEDRPAVLTVGGYGTPRYLCASCDKLFESAVSGTDPDKITESCRKIGETLTGANCDDELVIDTVNELIGGAIRRRDRIEQGLPEPSEIDEQEHESGEFAEFDEVPEEWRESEEDAELDRAEQEEEKRKDTVWGYVTAAILGVAVIAAIVIFLLR